MELIYIVYITSKHLNKYLSHGISNTCAKYLKLMKPTFSCG